LITGYRTRFAVVACLVLMISLHQRNGLVCNAGDRLLEILLFWAAFLPLGLSGRRIVTRPTRPNRLEASSTMPPGHPPVRTSAPLYEWAQSGEEHLAPLRVS
jgi:hypothetical protein